MINKERKMSLAEARWFRAWRCQIGYALNAGSMEDFERYCRNAMTANARYLIAQVLPK